MLPSVPIAMFAAAGLGLAIGLSMGAAGGAVVALPCLVGLMWMLARANLSAAAAARVLASFAVGLLGAGHAGFALGTPAELRALAAVPLVALVLANGACAALLGYVGFTLCRSAGARVTLLVPSLWTFQEWLFSLSDLAVPWIRLGYSQAAGGPLAPFAGWFPVGGVLLVGWSMLAACGVAAVWLQAGTKPRWLVWSGVLLVALAAPIVVSQVEWTRPGGSLSVDLIQSGIGAKDKSGDANAGRILGLYDSVLRASRAELVVGPQLAIPKIAAALPEGYLARLLAGLQQRQADALLGIYFSAGGPREFFNGVLGVGRSGVQRHLKHRLFPFGESVPLGGWPLEWVQGLLPAPMQGTQPGPAVGEALQVGAHRAAVAVCFEAAFGDAWRLSAATAGLLVNVSSDSAVDSPQLSGQFKLVGQARAREFQKPLVRTSDVRGTYFVDASGQLSGELAPHIHAVAHGIVFTRVGLTPYARFGDRLALLWCALVLGSAWLLSRGLAPARGPADAMRRGAAAAQSGQVLPLAAVLVLIIGGFFYLMVNAGQSVSEKMRVTNAADAAAYSAAVAEARALNYDAYLNRAMVANQIAIAQMVSFASWVNYFATAADNFGANAADVNFFLLPNPDVAVLDVMFGGAKIAATYFGGKQVQEYADYIVEGAGVIITAHDIAVTALSAMQTAVHVNLAAGVRQAQIADQIVKAMDEQLQAEVVHASHGFDAFTRTYGKAGGSGDERGRFADVTMRSRDPFTRERNWTVKGDDIYLIRDDGALKKRSGTELIGYDEWRAVDTLELHGRKFGCGRFGLDWCSDIKRPIGWGAIEVDAGGGDAGAGYHGNAYKENPTTAGVADGAMTTPAYAHFSGLPGSRELSDLDPAAEISTGITIRVSKAQAGTLTSGNAAQAKPSGRLDLFSDHPAAGRLAALSRAEVFFDRIAPRADGKSEIGSLYNPYWRVRLVAPTAADKAYAAAKQGGLVLP